MKNKRGIFKKHTEMNNKIQGFIVKYKIFEYI